MIRELVAKKGGVKISNTLAFKIWSGQVTNDKWIVSKVDTPMTDTQREQFKLLNFKNRLSKIDCKLFKKFHVSYVKRWTQRLPRVKEGAEHTVNEL